MAFNNCISHIDPKVAGGQYCIGFDGDFGTHELNSQSIDEEFISKMVCFKGTVIKSSSIFTNLVKSSHYCPTTNLSIYWSKHFIFKIKPCKMDFFDQIFLNPVFYYYYYLILYIYLYLFFRRNTLKESRN